MQHDIRLVVTDLDGTLVAHANEIPPENIKALKDVYARGIHVAICSGRDALNMSKIAMEAGLPDCAILSLNGSYILDRPFGHVLESVHMDPVSAKACLDVVLGHGGELLVCADTSFGICNTPLLEQMLRNPSRGSSVDAVDDVPALYQMAAQGLNKLVYTERENPEKLEAVRRAIEKIPNVTVTSSWHCNIEIMPLGIDKGVAVARLAERLNISLNQVIAFGDNDNDIPMLSTVGFGVAMGNAIDPVRNIARYVTDTNLNHGVAKALHTFILAS